MSGDVEEWRVVPSLHGDYEVSDFGRVRRATDGINTHAGRILKESQAGSKVTEAMVVEIRASAASGVSLAALAREYGITSANVGYIVRRQTWRHIP